MATDQQTNVSPATDEDRAIATITMAFSNDPVARWVLRDPNLYLTYWPRVVKAFGGPHSRRAPRTRSTIVVA